MNLRRRYIPIVAGVTAVIGGLLVATTLLLSHRLPDPIAFDWESPSGVPQGSVPLWTYLLIIVSLWAVPAGFVLARMLRGSLLTRRHPRAWAGATLTGSAALALGIHALTIHANLDRADWRDAGHLAFPGPMLVVLLAMLAGLVGWVLFRLGPDEVPDPVRQPTLVRPLRPGERAVWVSSISASWAVIGACGLLVLAFGFATFFPVTAGEYRLRYALLLGVAAIVGLMLSSVRVQVDRGGLAVALGPLRLPMRRIPLHRIESAWVETRRPSDVGGWGYRVRPGGATIMIRGGECLVVRDISGRELAVSVDRAEQGAALLNALIARYAGKRS